MWEGSKDSKSKRAFYVELHYRIICNDLADDVFQAAKDVKMFEKTILDVIKIKFVAINDLAGEGKTKKITELEDFIFSN